MQKWVVVCWALLALVCAEDCPDGGRCAQGHTCCSTPTSGYNCCPLHQAECCGDHVHCCPEGTICDMTVSSCVNATVSIPWVERVLANQPGFSKSFRMIRTYMREEDDNVCPDQSRCPPEFSCLRALTRFGCCPLAQGIPCSDGKHCCPGGHQCSEDSHSCIKKEQVSAVICPDGVSECPEESTCCESPDGSWGCCPMPKAVCCEDKIHCCPEGSTCDVEQSKCISLSKKVMPMWAKLPARRRAEWENQKEGAVTAKALSDQTEKVPELTTVNTVRYFGEEEVSSSTEGKEKVPDITTVTTVRVFGTEVVSPSTEAKVTTVHPFGTEVVSPSTKSKGNNVPCNETVACEDGTTCCKTEEGEWACCPLPEAVCCEDHIHCCPHGKKCNLAEQTCEGDSSSVPWLEKVPTIPREVEETCNVPCDSTHSCPDQSTCCKTATGDWACCPLPEAVCCPDHIHCCPANTTCDDTGTQCQGPLGLAPMLEKIAAFTTVAPVKEETTTGKDNGEDNKMVDRENKEEQKEEAEVGEIQCDPHTSCPDHTTCCFMASAQRWGCCPLPQAVCCSDGLHCCPANYRCDGSTCVKGEVVIPWYTKLPASTSSQDDAESVQCDAQNKCPEHSSCCQLSTGQWGCCPLEKAVCCPDREHCCPQGYSCNMASGSCQKLIMLQLQSVPLTRVYELKPQAQPHDVKHKEVKCDDQFTCPDGNTCCRLSPTKWGCCPAPNAMCCSDMKHCCPAGYSCGEGGTCTQNSGPFWHNWNVFFGNKKRALVV